MLIVSYPKEPVVPFSPEQLSGLQIWMDASDGATITTVDDGGTDRVSAWSSKAGPARSFAQATLAESPEFKSAGALFFDASREDHLALAETSGLDWSDGTLVAVYIPEDTETGKFIFATGDGAFSRLRIHAQATEGVRLDISGSPSGAASISTSRAGEVVQAIGRWEDGVSTVIQDDLAVSSVDTSYGTPNLVYDAIAIGKRFEGTPQTFQGHIAEILLWDRKLTDIETADVAAYLSAKHAGLLTALGV